VKVDDAAVRYGEAKWSLDAGAALEGEATGARILEAADWGNPNRTSTPLGNTALVKCRPDLLRITVASSVLLSVRLRSMSVLDGCIGVGAFVPFSYAAPTPNLVDW
jgi:hypothetical protein